MKSEKLIEEKELRKWLALNYDVENPSPGMDRIIERFNEAYTKGREDEENKFWADVYPKCVDDRTKAILQKMKKAYKKRLEHRRNCNQWDKKEYCIECGFGINNFIEDIFGEDWELLPEEYISQNISKKYGEKK